MQAPGGEPAFDSGVFPEPGFGARGGEGALRKKEKALLFQRKSDFKKRRGKPSLQDPEQTAPFNSD